MSNYEEISKIIIRSPLKFCDFSCAFTGQLLHRNTSRRWQEDPVLSADLVWSNCSWKSVLPAHQPVLHFFQTFIRKLSMVLAGHIFRDFAIARRKWRCRCSWRWRRRWRRRRKRRKRWWRWRKIIISSSSEDDEGKDNEGDDDGD